MLKKILKINKKIILISVLLLVVFSGVVFAFQNNRQLEQNKDSKSLLEDFSDGGFRSAQSYDKNNEVENPESYSPQAVLVDEIINDSNNKKQEFGITQYLNFFAKIANDVFGIKREIIFQPVNKIIETKENTKIYRIIKVPGEYSSIQLAIDNAEAGDRIEVAAGEYKENIIMKEGVSVIGEGILTSSDHGSLYQIESENRQELLEENDDPQKSYLIINKIISSTILNGENSGNIVSFKNGITDKTELAGFTIKNSGKSLSGIFIENSSPRIYENFITDNEYGIYIKGVSSPVIQKNIIRFASKGIQVYNFEELESSAQDDKTDEDGQDSSSQETVANGEEKELSSEASELSSFSSLSKPMIIDNLITDNKIGIDLYQSSALIEHNTISYNNHYKTYLGSTYGIYLNNSSAEIKNNIITDSGICELCSGINVNKESKGVVMSYNNIWNNKNNFVCFGECVMEDNNFSEDPLFIDSVNGDYRLSEESSLIGKAGDESDVGIRW